jgi:hypothetical protein
MTEVNFTLSNAQIVLLSLVVAWDFIWKCFAVWRAAKNNDHFFFVALLLINSVGIIPILYLVYKKYTKD